MSLTTSKEIKGQIEGSILVKQKLLTDDALINQLCNLKDICCNAIRSGGKVIFAGNGGSFADAQHLSAEFTSRFMFDRAPMASVALGVNNSAISAIGNDYGYEQVFSRELLALGNALDVFIPISTSGNSQNILQAVKTAKKLGIVTVALTGVNGGKLHEICECIRIPSAETARIQESHILVGHILCGLIEAEIFKGDDKFA